MALHRSMTLALLGFALAMPGRAAEPLPVPVRRPPVIAPSRPAEPTPQQKAAIAVADARLHSDWPWLGYYQSANAQLPPSGREARIVFMGASVTEHWGQLAPEFFSAGRIDRGISGQTTPQMLLRFRQDVIDLHPAVVQILAGTNDIAGNTGPMTAEQTEANFRSMTELAQAHGIRVILASITPSSAFPWRPGLAVTARIEAINAWLRQYAASVGAVYADYWSVLKDNQGAMRADLTYDGVHPNKAGYAVMAPLAEQAIAQALARPAPTPIASAGVP